MSRTVSIYQPERLACCLYISLPAWSDILKHCSSDQCTVQRFHVDTAISERYRRLVSCWHANQHCAVASSTASSSSSSAAAVAAAYKCQDSELSLLNNTIFLPHDALCATVSRPSDCPSIMLMYPYRSHVKQEAQPPLRNRASALYFFIAKLLLSS